jgi:hypothetical protein
MGDHYTGIEYTFSAAASDPDNDTLTYSWTVEGGTLADSTSNPILWTMPNTEGDYDITVVVDDGNGGTASLTETVTVTSMLGPPLAVMDIPIVSSEGGYIIQGGPRSIGPVHRIGDTSGDDAMKGFVSFDITGLSGANIESVALYIYFNTISGNLSNFKPFLVSSVKWEPGAIVVGDFNLPQDTIGVYNHPDINCTNINLEQYLQNAIDSGRSRFQLMLFFTGMATDNDGSDDYWEYHDNDITLKVTYTH